MQDEEKYVRIKKYDNFSSMKEYTMNRFDFNQEIMEALEEIYFEKPTEIQKEIIPVMRKGLSVIGQSRTGSGKTHAYLLPIFEKAAAELDEVQAVIIAPTRELADQIYTAGLQLNSKRTAPLDIRAYIGGSNKQKSISKLKTQPHIVIGTPGRIHDLIRSNDLDVHKANTLVVDEADLAFDMGFLLDVDQIAGSMPKKLQMCVFSATIPDKLKPFLNKYMENPVHVQIRSNVPTVEEIKQYLIYEKSQSKTQVLLSLMKTINPYICMIFTNTKKSAESLAMELAEAGVRVGKIHGDLDARERKKMMKQVRDLEFSFIVATDLAARGIDIPGVSHVINYELPQDLDFYIHRIGRTARAGAAGDAFSIVSYSDEEKLDQLEKRKIPLTIVEIKDGEVKEIGPRHRRKIRKKTNQDLDKTARRLFQKPNEVKPGYKKKLERKRAAFKKKTTRGKKS